MVSSDSKYYFQIGTVQFNALYTPIDRAITIQYYIYILKDYYIQDFL